MHTILVLLGQKNKVSLHALGNITTNGSCNMSLTTTNQTMLIGAIITYQYRNYLTNVMVVISLLKRGLIFGYRVGWKGGERF